MDDDTTRDHCPDLWCTGRLVYSANTQACVCRRCGYVDTRVPADDDTED